MKPSNHLWGWERVSRESQYMITLFLFYFLNYVFGHFYIFYLFKLKVWTPLFFGPDTEIIFLWNILAQILSFYHL